MSEYIVNLPDSKAVDEVIARFGVQSSTLFDCALTGEIVRCYDCRFSVSYGRICTKPYELYDVEPAGYCAWGERKEVRDD